MRSVDPGSLFCLAESHDWSVAPSEPYKQDGVWGKRGQVGRRTTQVCDSCGSVRFRAIVPGSGELLHSEIRHSDNYRQGLDLARPKAYWRAKYYRTLN